MRLAIMQPYLWSAWGYYRLFAAADMFIIYDDCQYMRGGWVNRNRFTHFMGGQNWFTLPLKKMPLQTKINEIEWAKDAREELEKSYDKFPVFKKLRVPLPDMEYPPFDTIYDSLFWVLAECHMQNKAKAMCSSSLPIAAGLRGQDKVIEICKYFKATEYINLSGGAGLYDKKAFNGWGIDLQFLPETADKTNILEKIAQGGGLAVRDEIYANLS